MSSILKQRIRYIVPFMTSGDNRLEISESGWLAGFSQRNEHDVYKYIIDSVSQGSGLLTSNIGFSYSYEKENDAILSLAYHQKNNKENNPENTEIIYFDITDMGLYLFKSRVGFFWYEIGCFRITDENGKSVDITLSSEEVILFNSRFKELNYGSNTKIFNLKDSSEPITIGNWATKVITSALGDITFFASRINTLYKRDPQNNPLYVPDKALIYNYTAFEGMEKKDLVDFAYQMTKGYKKSYRVPDDIKSRVRFPFGNVLWYACNEGAGYYALAEEDNKGFFINGMATNFMADYFLLYILALNNRYSLIRFSERIGKELPADETAYTFSGNIGGSDINGIREKKELYELEQRVTRLVTAIDVFLTKNVRASVSYVEHQSDFYDYLIQVFRVRESIEGLSTGVAALQRLLAKVVETERYFDNNEELLSWRKESEYSQLQQEKETLQSEIYKDGLTGLFNQKGYLRFAKEIFNNAKEKKLNLFICSADMNGLKHINDNYGHEEGNRAIKGCIDILRYAAKEDDMLFRTGGDEFVVMGYRDKIDGEEEDFSSAAEEKRHMINDDAGLPYEIAISYGPIIRNMGDYSGNLDELFKESDDKMYAMKILKDKYRRT